MATFAASRAERMQELCAPAVQDVVVGLLTSSAEVRIAVPCAVLSKGASGTGSKVVVTVLRRSHGCTVALDCGQWWRGAPQSAVYMDYRQLLHHANDDALLALHRKLMSISNSRSRSLARTASVPGRILLDELTSSGGRCSGAGSRSSLRRTSSTGLPDGGGASGLQRTSSMGLPAGSGSGSGSGLRRTSSTGMPSPSPGGSVGSSTSGRPGGSIPRGASSLHRLSASAFPQPGSAAKAPAASELYTPPKQRHTVSAAADATGAAADALTPQVMLPFPLCLEDSAGHAEHLPAAMRLSLDSPERLQRLRAADWSNDIGGTSPQNSPVGGGSPATAAPGSDSSGSRLELSRQGTFSQPYFAEFEDELSSAAAVATEEEIVREIASPLAAEDSGPIRAAELAAAQDRMTSDELHEVDSNFNHVFVPPWAVPTVPQQQVVRTYREAGVQTSTGAASVRPPARQSHTASDVADHFQDFMQHFAASLPHLAMALADLHLTRGGQDPTFVKSHFYFNALLHMKDDMGQVAQQLQPLGNNISSCSWM